MVPGVDIVRMKNITELNNQLHSLKREITKYQDECSHDTECIKALANNEVKVVCKKCDKNLRWPSQKELTDWLKK